MEDYEPQTVRRIMADDWPGLYATPPAPEPERSGPQRHVDVAFDAAAQDAENGHDALETSVEWMKTIGEVPAEFRNLPLLVSQYQEWIKEKRRVRG